MNARRSWWWVIWTLTTYLTAPLQGKCDLCVMKLAWPRWLQYQPGWLRLLRCWLIISWPPTLFFFWNWVSGHRSKWPSHGVCNQIGQVTSRTKIKLTRAFKNCDVDPLLEDLHSALWETSSRDIDGKWNHWKSVLFNILDTLAYLLDAKCVASPCHGLTLTLESSWEREIRYVAELAELVVMSYGTATEISGIKSLRH